MSTYTNRNETSANKAVMPRYMRESAGSVMVAANAKKIIIAPPTAPTTTATTDWEVVNIRSCRCTSRVILTTETASKLASARISPKLSSLKKKRVALQPRLAMTQSTNVIK